MTPDYSELTDEQQVKLIRETDNSLTPDDREIKQDENGPDLNDPDVEVVEKL